MRQSITQTMLLWIVLFVGINVCMGLAQGQEVNINDAPGELVRLANQISDERTLTDIVVALASAGRVGEAKAVLQNLPSRYHREAADAVAAAVIEVARMRHQPEQLDSAMVILRAMGHSPVEPSMQSKSLLKTPWEQLALAALGLDDPMRALNAIVELPAGQQRGLAATNLVVATLKEGHHTYIELFFDLAERETGSGRSTYERIGMWHALGKAALEAGFTDRAVKAIDQVQKIVALSRESPDKTISKENQLHNEGGALKSMIELAVQAGRPDIAAMILERMRGEHEWVANLYPPNTPVAKVTEIVEGMQGFSGPTRLEIIIQQARNASNPGRAAALLESAIPEAHQMRDTRQRDRVLHVSRKVAIDWAQITKDRRFIIEIHKI